MDTKSILDQLIGASRQSVATGERIATEKGFLPSEQSERTAMLKGAGAGALAAGAVAMLMGNKKTKKFGKKALKLGGTAALGGLAYKVFTDWQQQQQAASTPSAGPGTPIGELPDHSSNARSEAIVRAMIAAARADGHIDDTERSHIEQQIQQLGLEQDVTGFLLAELGQPVDASRVAALADSPEAAAEMYLASVLVIDEQNPAERQYLDELANAMGLDPVVVKRLEGSLQNSLSAS